LLPRKVGIACPPYVATLSHPRIRPCLLPVMPPGLKKTRIFFVLRNRAKANLQSVSDPLLARIVGRSVDELGEVFPPSRALFVLRRFPSLPQVDLVNPAKRPLVASTFQSRRFDSRPAPGLGVPRFVQVRNLSARPNAARELHLHAG